jgi:hypothetical protein
MRVNMGLYESIDDLVDEILNESQEKPDGIKKRRPKPFRYINDKKEIKFILSELSEAEKQRTIMKNPNKTELFNEEIFKVSMGDIKTIEDIIKKHQVSRKIK